MSRTESTLESLFNFDLIDLFALTACVAFGLLIQGPSSVVSFALAFFLYLVGRDIYCRKDIGSVELEPKMVLPILFSIIGGAAWVVFNDGTLGRLDLRIVFGGLVIGLASAIPIFIAYVLLVSAQEFI